MTFYSGLPNFSWFWFLCQAALPSRLQHRTVEALTSDTNDTNAPEKTYQGDGYRPLQCTSGMCIFQAAEHPDQTPHFAGHSCCGAIANAFPGC